MEEDTLEIVFDENLEVTDSSSKDLEAKVAGLEKSHFENLALDMDEDDLDEIGRKVYETYQADLSSREEWEQMTVEAIEDLGLIANNFQEPFEGACSATDPLILESVVKFQSKASNELLPASGPVRTKIIGKSTVDKEDQAFRVKTDMNYLVQEAIPEFYNESDKNLFFVGLIGNGFKRKYYCPIKDRTCDEMVFPDKLVVNNLSKSLGSAERISYVHYMSERLMDQYTEEGIYVDNDYGSSYSPETTDFEDIIREIQGISSERNSYDDIYVLIEQHCYLKLNDDKVARPYIITIEKHTQKVCAITRNWSENDSKFKRLDWFTHYMFVPTAGFYALGYAHLLGNIQKALTVSLRSISDAGQLANLQGGFVNSKLKIKGDGAISPGEFRDVEVIGVVNKLEDMFFPLPFKEPSATLFGFMQNLRAVGQKFADSTEQVIADSTNYGPVGTTMALLEASTRFFAAIYKRLYTAQADEFRIIARIEHDYGSESYAWDAGEFQDARKEDYDHKRLRILPVADPNFSSQAQRLSRAQAMFDTARQAPKEHNMREILIEFHKALGNEDVEIFLPKPEEPQKREPLEDIQAVISGQPIKAFPEQDHKSHITVKTAFLEDKTAGGSEVMREFVPLILANIQEHAFLDYMNNVNALQQQGFGLEEATQRLKRLNDIAEEEAQKGTPAMLLAQAEMIKALADQAKEQRESINDTRDFGLKLLDVSVRAERETNRATESGRKIDLTEEQMALDLIKEGLKKDG